MDLELLEAREKESESNLPWRGCRLFAQRGIASRLSSFWFDNFSQARRSYYLFFTTCMGMRFHPWNWGEGMRFHPCIERKGYALSSWKTGPDHSDLWKLHEDATGAAFGGGGTSDY